MRKDIRQTAYYALIGSGSLLLASLGIPTLQRWERVQRVAQGVFLASAAVVVYRAVPSKAKTISDLADVKDGSLDDLSKFAYDNDAQFWQDWKRDKRTEEDLKKFQHQELIKKFFHQGLGNAVVIDLQERFDIDQWNLQLGILPDAKFQIEETENTLKITYSATVRLLEEVKEYFQQKLTSTLTVDVASKSATSFIYTLEPLDESE